jgi:diacylglycerol kinase family enzyme
MPTLVIYNPVCGDGTAKSFLDTSVLPLLRKHGKAVDKIARTESVGDAGTLLVDFMESREGAVTVVLASGDGVRSSNLLIHLIVFNV